MIPLAGRPHTSSAKWFALPGTAIMGKKGVRSPFRWAIVMGKKVVRRPSDDRSYLARGEPTQGRRESRTDVPREGFPQSIVLSGAHPVARPFGVRLSGLLRTHVDPGPAMELDAEPILWYDLSIAAGSGHFTRFAAASPTGPPRSVRRPPPADSTVASFAGAFGTALARGLPEKEPTVCHHLLRQPPSLSFLSSPPLPPLRSPRSACTPTSRRPSPAWASPPPRRSRSSRSRPPCAVAMSWPAP